MIRLGQHMTITRIASEGTPWVDDGKVVALHDDYLVIWSDKTQALTKVKRENCMTDDQIRRYYYEDE